MTTKNNDTYQYILVERTTSLLKGDNKMINYYKCYSIPLKRFLAANEVWPISEGINQKTQRNFWVYVLDNELSELLTLFTEAKRKAKGE